ncbi:MAG: response regulator [Bacteroidales bacterium]|nr:response regulator [Bacteroidales bacterium]
MPDFKKYKVLYVDDEEINIELFVLNFESDFPIITALSALEGLKILEKEKISLVITDLKMPRMNGMDFLREIKQKYPDKECVILSAFTEPDEIMKALNEDLVFKYMIKPWKRVDMFGVIEEGVERYMEKNSKY